MNALLAVVSVAMLMLLLEAGMRVYYAMAARPLVLTVGSTSEEWKQRWLERYRQPDVETAYDFDQYHPLFGWSTKPNLSGFEVAGLPPVTTDAQGWRSPRDYSYERRPGMTRIVVLGDGLTFGEHARDEDVWTVQLEHQLDNTEVLNLAVNGYGTDQQLRVLEEEGIKYHPDVVVAGVFVDDIFRNGLRFRDYAKPMYVLRDKELVLTNSPVPPPNEILAQAVGPPQWSYLVYFVRRQLARLRRRDRDDVVDERDLFALTRAIMQKMQAVTTTNDAHLLVVIIPGRLGMTRVESLLEQWAGEIGYAVINVGPSLTRAEQVFRRMVYVDYYHNTLGDLVMATSVAGRLTEERWVPPPSDDTTARLRQRFHEVIEKTPPT